MQNLGHDGDDESENGLKVSKEERKAYLAERAAKMKAQRRAYISEYRKRPEVVARRKASEAERAVKKKAKNEAEIVGKTKATNRRYGVFPVMADICSLSQQSDELEEVL
jgi:hypothetical protein